ncbi:MAG TPA: hypothetical protein VK030_00700 [Actinomycetales bacterium]|nr:hypothetical protein [Actinomycetales bacterium]
MNPAEKPRTRRGRLTGPLAVLNIGLLLFAACSVTEGRVTLADGPPRVAGVNSPVKPSKVVEGSVEYVGDGDCFVLVDADSDKRYAVAWPMKTRAGDSAALAAIILSNGTEIAAGTNVIASGEVDLPDSDQAAQLPQLPQACGADDGGWLLIADITPEQ